MKKRLIFDIACFVSQTRLNGICRCSVEILSRLNDTGKYEIALICSLPNEASAVYCFKKLYPNNLPFQSKNSDSFAIPEQEPLPPPKASFLGRLEDGLVARFPSNRLLKILIATARKIKWAIKPPPPPVKYTERPRSPKLERLVRESDIYFSPLHAPVQEVDTNPEMGIFQIVYDMIPVLYPNWFPKEWNDTIADHWINITRRVRVLAISNCTKYDLLKCFPHIEEKQVTVIPLGADERFKVYDNRDFVESALHRHGIPPEGRYILSVATLEPRKNFEQVILSFAKLIEIHEKEFPDLRLVLTGGKGWLDEKIHDAYDRLPQTVKKRVIFTGYVEDDDLPLLYNGASCFCYMSFYEGFGLPPLEAMQSGVPVVTSDNSSLPEVVGDAGILLDATDTEGLVNAWQHILTDNMLRHEMIEKGRQQARKFSWDHCVAIIQDLMDETPPKHAHGTDET